MNQIMTIAGLVLKEAKRDRLYIGIFIFAFLFVLLALILGMSPWGHIEEVMLHLGFGGLSFFALLFSVFMSVNSVWRDVQSRVVYTIFSRPVKRWKFIVGKYLGVVVYLFFVIAGISIIILSFTYLTGYTGKLRIEAFLISWRIFVQSFTTAAYAFLFVTITSPVLAIILTFIVHFINTNSQVLVELAEKTGSGALKTAVKVLYVIFPDYSYLYVDEAVIHLKKILFSDLVVGTVLCLLYSAVMIILSCAIFSRKEL